MYTNICSVTSHLIPTTSALLDSPHHQIPEIFASPRLQMLYSYDESRADSMRSRRTRLLGHAVSQRKFWIIKSFFLFLIRHNNTWGLDKYLTWSTTEHSGNIQDGPLECWLLVGARGWTLGVQVVTLKNVTNEVAHKIIPVVWNLPVN